MPGFSVQQSIIFESIYIYFAHAYFSWTEAYNCHKVGEIKHLPNRTQRDLMAQRLARRAEIREVPGSSPTQD